MLPSSINGTNVLTHISNLNGTNVLTHIGNLNATGVLDNIDNLKQNLTNELSESIEYGLPVCATGRFNRIIDTLNKRIKTEP